ncbi:hypothetical protein ACOMHN_024524 [Nucella lapillus]
MATEWMSPFASAKLGSFAQEAPQLGNQYTQDSLLRSFLKRNIPQQSLAEIKADLTRFGHRVGTDIYDLHLRCEREQPTVVQTDSWGHRVDDLRTSSAWTSMHHIASEEGLIALAYERKFGASRASTAWTSMHHIAAEEGLIALAYERKFGDRTRTAWTSMHHIAAEEGLIALAYERKFGASSRLYQASKLYLFSPSSGLYSCPLAMADGAASLIESIQTSVPCFMKAVVCLFQQSIQTSVPWLVERALKRLVSRDPSRFWTSGQWMTEKRGGSDVARGTETVAVEQTDGSYSLYGYNFYDFFKIMTFTLARVVDKQGHTVEGTKGVSLFYLEVSDEGRGVAGISNMLTLTRLHNSLSASSVMRRMVNLARDYSTRRQAFGRVLKDYPLHVQTLASMEVETRGASLFALELSRLLGRHEVGEASETESLFLRLMVPVMKLYTGKQAVAVTSEGLECFGGQGYIEDTGLPSMLRDAQVLSIWEGTTNILSLDALRAIAKSQGAALHAFSSVVKGQLRAASGIPDLEEACDKVGKGAESVLTFAANHSSHLEVAARDFAYSLARVAIGAMLIDHAASSVGSPQDVYAAVRWCEKDLTPVLTAAAHNTYTPDATAHDRQLVFDGYLHPSRL